MGYAKPTLDAPAISNHELDQWLANQETKQTAAWHELVEKYELFRSSLGEDETWTTEDQKDYEKARGLATLAGRARSLLYGVGVFGQPPGRNPDADNEFIEIMREWRKEGSK